MLDRWKRFYEDHQEAVVASAISAVTTGVAVAAVATVKYRQVRFTRFEIWAPPEIPDEVLRGQQLELALYLKNGRVAVLPAPYTGLMPAPAEIPGSM